jgi:hypothetical protein
MRDYRVKTGGWGKSLNDFNRKITILWKLSRDLTEQEKEFSGNVFWRNVYVACEKLWKNY